MGAGTVNKVILVGNLGKDPEIRTTQDGREIANFSLATSEHWTDRNSGERREKTEWHKVVIFNPNLVKFVKAYVKKGTKVFVEGQLQTRKWQDQGGQDRYTTEVVIQGFNGTITFLSKADGSRPASNGDDASDYANATGAQYAPGGDNELDDEIPF